MWACVHTFVRRMGFEITLFPLGALGGVARVDETGLGVKAQAYTKAPSANPAAWFGAGAGTGIRTGAPCEAEELSDLRVCVLADRSGSMTIMSSLVPAVLQEGLLNAGVSPSTQVHYVTFDGLVEVEKCTVHTMHTLETPSRGCTFMAKAVLEFQKWVLETSKHTRVLLVIVSDGMVDDKATTVSESQRALAALREKDFKSVSVVMVQVGGHADVSAMCQLGTGATEFNGADTIRLQELYREHGVVDDAKALQWKQEAARKVSGAVLKVCTSRCLRVCLTTGEAHLRTSPLQLERSQVNLSPGTGFVLLSPSAFAAVDDGEAGMCVNGGIVPVKVVQPKFDNLRAFISMLATMSRIHILGDPDADTAHRLREWNMAFCDVVEAATLKVEAGPASDHARFSTRIRVVLRDAKKAASSAIVQLRELQNTEAMRALASAQPAGFLDGTVTAALTKRSKVSGDDLHTELQRALGTVVDLTECLETDAAGLPASFWSMATSEDMVRELRTQFLAHDSHTKGGPSLDVEDILTLCGLHGCPVRVVVGENADPWRVCVEEVYSGAVLSTSDVLHVGPGKLTAPGHGPDATINAVVPLAMYNPRKVWAWLGHAGACKAIEEAAVSAMLRGVITPVAYDSVAFQAAVLLFLLRRGSSVEVEVDIVRGLQHQLAAVLTRAGTRASFAAFAEGLSSDVPSSVLIGGDGTSMTKALLAILCSPDCEALRANKPALARALVAVFDLAVYWQVRSQYTDTRAAALEQVLVNRTSARPDGDAHEHEHAHEHAHADSETFTQKPLPEILEGVALAVRSLEMAAAASTPASAVDAPSGTPGPGCVQLAWDTVVAVARYLGVPRLLDGERAQHLITAAAFVHGLQCSNEAERRASAATVSGFSSTIGCVGFLGATGTSVLADVRKATQDLRDKALAHAEMVQKMKALANATDANEFLRGLRTDVVKRDTAAFKELWWVVTTTPVQDVAFKVFVLATGRDLVPLAHSDSGPGPGFGFDLSVGVEELGGWMFQPVFACGGSGGKEALNTARALLREVDHPLFTVRGLEFAARLDQHVTYGITRVVNNMSNRNGHGPSTPSFTAMGFKSMEDFAEADPDAYAAYVYKVKMGYVHDPVLFPDWELRGFKGLQIFADSDPVGYAAYVQQHPERSPVRKLKYACPCGVSWRWVLPKTGEDAGPAPEPGAGSGSGSG